MYIVFLHRTNSNVQYIYPRIHPVQHLLQHNPVYHSLIAVNIQRNTLVSMCSYIMVYYGINEDGYTAYNIIICNTKDNYLHLFISCKCLDIFGNTCSNMWYTT